MSAKYIILSSIRIASVITNNYFAARKRLIKRFRLKCTVACYIVTGDAAGRSSIILRLRMYRTGRTKKGLV